MIATSSYQEVPVFSSPRPQRRAAMSPEQREKARSRDRIKYARRMERDSQGFRAKRCRIAARHYRRHRGVYVDLVL